jgi:hypothetical protein
MNTISLIPLWNEATPWLFDLMMLVVSVGGSIITYAIKKKTGLDFDALNRGSLHSALETGARAVLARAGTSIGDKTIDVGSKEVAAVINWVVASVPDALAHFNLDPDKTAAKLQTLAIAYLQKVIDGGTPVALSGLSPVGTSSPAFPSGGEQGLSPAAQMVSSRLT